MHVEMARSKEQFSDSNVMPFHHSAILKLTALRIIYLLKIRMVFTVLNWFLPETELNQLKWFSLCSHTSDML